MSHHRLVTWSFAALLILLGLSILAVVFIPYATMKIVLNLLARDGNLSILKPENAIAFRFLISIFSFSILGLAYLIGMRRWEVVVNFFKQLWKDCRSYLLIINPTRVEKSFLGALLVVVVLAVIRRLAFIEAPMMHDEAYAVMSFSDTIFHAITDYSLPNNHIFHTILVNLSVRLFGFASWTVRLPAFVAGVLIVPGVYLLAKRIYDPWTGLVASLLTAFAPVLINYSTNARGYTLVALFTLIILILGDYVRRKRKLFAWGLISIFSALGLYTVPVMLFPLGVLFTWLFLENLVANTASYSSKWEFFRYWLFTGLIAVFLTVLFYTPILIYTGPHDLFANGFVASLPWGDLLDTWNARFIETWREWTLGVPLAIIITMVAGWILGLIFHRKLSKTRIPLQLASFLWIASLLFIQRPNAWAKVWVFLFPIMLIWAVAGVVGLMRNVRFKFAHSISLAAIVTSVLLLVGVWSSIQLVPKLPGLWASHGDVENAVLFLKNYVNETDLIVVDWPDDSPTWFYSLEYGINNSHFDKRIPYHRALVLVNQAEGQTLESVLADRGPDIPPLDLTSARLLQKFGTRQVFECSAK